MRPDAHTLVAAYALDALDEDEREDVREHLEQCETCREDLRSFRETVAALAATAAEAPPARMREAVLARARDTLQLPPLTGRPAEPQGQDSHGQHSRGQDSHGQHSVSRRVDASLAEAAEPPAGPPGDVAGASRRGRLSRATTTSGGSQARRAPVSRTVLGLAASVLTVAALGAGAFGVVQSERLDDARSQQAAYQKVLSADDLVTLSGATQLPDGVQGDEVVVLASASQDAALLLPAGLPTAPEGLTWQAWTVTGDRAVSAGTFDAASGDAFALQAPLAGADAVAVSLEPAGGSERPSSTPVVVLPLT